MAASLRTAGAVVLISMLGSNALAASMMEAAVSESDWSVAAALAADDERVVLVSDVEPTPADASQDSAAGCDSCCGDTCCGDCDCVDCGDACGCGPKWYATAGVILLKRDRPAPGTVVGANPGGGVPSFSSASDFSFDWDAGVEVGLARRFSGGNILEARYFGVDSTDTNSFRTPGGFIGAGFTGPANTLFDGKYLSKLNSSEINLRHAMNNRLTLLGGFRWVELKDEMFYKINGNVATGDYEYNNRLYGGQLGASFTPTRPGGRLIANIEGKGGVYGNVADGGIFEYQGNNFIGSFVDRSTTMAFVGEINMTLGYRLNRHVVVRSGYQLLWLGDVALAGDAASRSLLNPSLLRSNRYSDLFYQGATAGFDVAF